MFQPPRSSLSSLSLSSAAFVIAAETADFSSLVFDGSDLSASSDSSLLSSSSSSSSSSLSLLAAFFYRALPCKPFDISTLAPVGCSFSSSSSSSESGYWFFLLNIEPRPAGRAAPFLGFVLIRPRPSSSSSSLSSLSSLYYAAPIFVF